MMNSAAHDLDALAKYHEDSEEPITPTMLRQLALKYRAQDIMEEIRANPEELAELELSRAQAERGEVRWLDDEAEEG